MQRRIQRRLRHLWGIGLLLLVACTPSLTPPPSIGGTATVPRIPTSTPHATATPTPIPSPTPKPRALILCLGTEPETLYPPEALGYAADFILSLAYDAPTTTAGYTYHPNILEKLPSLSDGNAVLTTVTVAEGDTVVDAEGRVVQLSRDVRLRPAGCRTPDCELTFDGTPVAMDQLRLTFHLKPGLLWSDGTPVTAHDSVYAFELSRDPATLNYRPLEMYTAAYTALDELTVQWVGRPGYLTPLYFLAFWQPLPRHAWHRTPPHLLRTDREAARRPMGYGPYVINRWEQGRTLYAHRNPHYRRADGKPPYFNAVLVRFLHNIEADRALDMLTEGSCHLLASDLHPEQAPARLQAMAENGEAHIYTTPGPIWEHLTFNVQPTAASGRAPFFADVRVRQAVAACINRQRLVDEVTYGWGSLLHAYVPTDHPLYGTAQVPIYTYAPAQGRAALEAVGWRDEDGDGIREAHGVADVADGTPFHVQYITLDSEQHRQIATRIAEDLAACGIQMDLSTYAPASFFTGGPESPLYGRAFDLAQFPWLTDPIPPCGLYLSEEIPSPENDWQGQNFGGYADAQYDEACRQAQVALPGETVYKTAHQAALRRFGETLPALPLYLRPRVVATRPDLTGLQLLPLEPETWNVGMFALLP